MPDLHILDGGVGKHIMFTSLFQKLYEKDSKKFKGSINKLNTSIKSFENDINSELKKLDSKSEKIKIKKYTIKDFT